MPKKPFIHRVEGKQESCIPDVLHLYISLPGGVGFRLCFLPGKAFKKILSCNIFFLYFLSFFFVVKGFQKSKKYPEKTIFNSCEPTFQTKRASQRQDAETPITERLEKALTMANFKRAEKTEKVSCSQLVHTSMQP